MISPGPFRACHVATWPRNVRSFGCLENPARFEEYWWRADHESRRIVQYIRIREFIDFPIDVQSLDKLVNGLWRVNVARQGGPHALCRDRIGGFDIELGGRGHPRKQTANSASGSPYSRLRISSVLPRRNSV